MSAAVAAAAVAEATPPGISLRDYVDWRFSVIDQSNQRERDILIKINDERWRVNETDHLKMNEIRQQLNDQASRFATRIELETEVRSLILALENYKTVMAEYRESLDRRMRAVENFQANITGRIAAIAGVGFLASIGVEILLHFVK